MSYHITSSSTIPYQWTYYSIIAIGEEHNILQNIQRLECLRLYFTYATVGIEISSFYCKLLHSDYIADNYSVFHLRRQ
jgi:hypothetical protein